MTDAATRRLLIVDRDNPRREPKAIAVGQVPRAIAVTPDGKKAYVANEEPIPRGTITVVDLDLFREVGKIAGIGCPEGMAISRDGTRLYVAPPV